MEPISSVFPLGFSGLGVQCPVPTHVVRKAYSWQGCKEGARVWGEAGMLLGRRGLFGGLRGLPHLLAVPPAAQPEPERCAGQPGEAAREQHLHSQGPAQVCDTRCPLALGGWGEVWSGAGSWGSHSCQARARLAFPAPGGWGFGLCGLASLCSGG